MSTLTVTKNYLDGTDLFEADLDAIISSLETYFNTTKLDAANIQSDAITTAKIATLAVTAAKLASTTVATANIAGSAVTTIKIADDAVTTAKILDGAVDETAINDAAVTIAKIEDVNEAASSSASGTSLSTSITTNGNRVVLILEPRNTSGTYFSVPTVWDGISVNEDAILTATLARDATTVSTETFRFSRAATAGSETFAVPTSIIKFTDQPDAGSYTYTLSLTGGTFVQLQLRAIEIY